MQEFNFEETNTITLAARLGLSARQKKKMPDYRVTVSLIYLRSIVVHLSGEESSITVDVELLWATILIQLKSFWKSF